MVYWQHWSIGGCVTVLLKNLPRWRADDIRPYELKNFGRSAKYAPGAMRYICVGEDSIFPVVSPMGKQRRRKCADNAIQHLQIKFGGIMSKRGIFATSEPQYGQYGSAQKLATLAGGYYPPLRSWCHRMTEQKLQ